MKCYYAHSVSIYDTKQEERDLATIESLGFKPVNPNHSTHDEGYKKFGMNYFDDIIASCDIVAFRAHPDGSIPAGVSKEIRRAIEFGRPVIELPSGILRRSLSVDQTREYLMEIGCR